MGMEMGKIRAVVAERAEADLGLQKHTVAAVHAHALLRRTPSADRHHVQGGASLASLLGRPQMLHAHCITTAMTPHATLSLRFRWLSILRSGIDSWHGTPVLLLRHIGVCSILLSGSRGSVEPSFS